MGVFLQNGRLLQHVNHLKQNGEAAASGLLYQDLTVRNGERVAIDIHYGVLFVICKVAVVLYVKTAGWQATKMNSCYHTAAPTPALAWNSRFCSVRVKINEYSIVEYRYKHHSFAETALCRQSVRVC